MLWGGEFDRGFYLGRIYLNLGERCDAYPIHGMAKPCMLLHRKGISRPAATMTDVQARMSRDICTRASLADGQT